jgi:hypothetical protein
MFSPLDAARFWSKVDVGSPDTCWPWKGGGNLYGEFKHGGKTLRAHRVAYVMVYGAVADGVVIRHACDNPACCNPAHLSPGTHAQNVRDRVERKRSALGERSGRAILTESQAREILASTETAAALAVRFGVSKYTIYSLLQGKSWKHLREADAAT